MSGRGASFNSLGPPTALPCVGAELAEALAVPTFAFAPCAGVDTIAAAPLVPVCPGDLGTSPPCGERGAVAEGASTSAELPNATGTSCVGAEIGCMPGTVDWRSRNEAGDLGCSPASADGDSDSMELVGELAACVGVGSDSLETGGTRAGGNGSDAPGRTGAGRIDDGSNSLECASTGAIAALASVCARAP